MFLLIMLLVMVLTTVISALLTPKPHFNQPAPSALGDFTFPTADEGRAIPLIAGTVKIAGGDVVWWGDLQIVPIVKNVKSGLFSHTKVTQGYRYYLGCQYALCMAPIDELVAISANNKQVHFTSSGSDPAILDIEQPNIFGGDTSEGGLQGKIAFYKGTQTQGSDPYLSSKQTAASATPSYSGTGNGGLSFLAPGAASVAETITITALSSFYTADPSQPYFGAREFSVVGSVSGAIGTAYGDFSFGSNKINFTITTGSIAFVPGDHWTVATLATRVSPSYKGLCYMVLRRFYMGTSSYPKPLIPIIRRCPDPFAWGLSDPRVNINGDANGALWIYELMTDATSGLGILPARMDDAAFITAATTLKNEALGVSMMIDSQSTADNLIGDILRHLDGAIYVDPTTDLFTIKLARADYDPDDVPEITVDDIQATPQFARASWSETVNQIIIKYVDRGQDFNTRSVQVQDPSNIAVTGEVRTQTIAYNGLSNGTTAMLVAMRVLRAIAYPLSKITIVVDRTSWNWRQCGVFKFTWAPLGIQDQIFRIAKIGYGEVSDGKITIDAVEDVFGLSITAFSPPPASGWVNPTGAPVEPAFQELEEVPYAFEPTGIFVMAMVARGDGTSKSFDVFQPIAGHDTFTNNVTGFSPLGLLAAKYPAGTPAADPTGFTIQVGGIDLNALVGTDDGGLFLGANLLRIDGEWMSWESFVVNMDGTITISKILRGVFDTVPADHATGARVWFFSFGVGETQLAAYPTDLTVQAKILPINNAGEFLLSSASYISLATRSRYARPYPPGNLRMQAQAYGVRYSTTVGDVVFTWSSRNRITQTAAGVITKQDDGDVTPEASTTYTVKISIAGSLVRTVTGITPETYTYAGDDRVTDGGLGPVKLDLYANANSLDSYQAQEAIFEMTGFGLDFGNFFGGLQA